MPPDAETLEAALQSAQQGDVAAFNLLVEAFQAQLYNICYRTLGNREDAADATQEAFLSAFRGLHSFRGSASGLRGWLVRVAINGCYDHLRRRQRRPVESLDALTGFDPETDHAISERLIDAEPGPELRSLSSETARAIQRALDGLPVEQRMTVVLCDVQGFSYEEAAEALRVELGTIKSRLSRARAHLRDMLSAAGELPPRSQRLEQRNA